MRPTRLGAVLVLAGLLAFSIGACRRGMCSQPARPLRWTSIASDRLEVVPLEHSIRFGIPLPPGVSAAGPGRRLELRFPRALDAAKVETYGSGPGHPLTPLHEARVRGNTLALTLPPLTLDRLDVVVHHHLRPAPLPPEVRVGKEVP
jgi:hypothetical protein